MSAIFILLEKFIIDMIVLLITSVVKEVGWLVGFYHISIFVGYLTPNSVCIYILLYFNVESEF